jgi:hypothetical protein
VILAVILAVRYSKPASVAEKGRIPEVSDGSQKASWRGEPTGVHYVARCEPVDAANGPEITNIYINIYIYIYISYTCAFGYY